MAPDSFDVKAGVGTGSQP